MKSYTVMSKTYILMKIVRYIQTSLMIKDGH